MPRSIPAILRKTQKALSDRLKSKNVFTTAKPQSEFRSNSSLQDSAASFYKTLTEITSSTPMSASITRYKTTGIGLNRSAFPELVRLNDGIYDAAVRSGSMLVVNDPASGSGIFVSGSYYSFAAGHGNTVQENFNTVCSASEEWMCRNIAKRVTPMNVGGINYFSSSYSTQISTIKNFS
tara:strand:- start:91 stop:627 length:537 start_codon:yes stop_codon:yes gene_type:complete